MHYLFYNWGQIPINAWLVAWLLLAGICARRRTHFLLLRQKKVSKEKATLLSVSLRFATGNLRCSRMGCAVELTARLWRFVQTTTASQFTMHGRFDAHAHPMRCAPRHGQKGTRDTGHRCARPGAARREAPAPIEAERSDGPCRAVHPPVAAPGAGCLRGGMRALARMLRALTCRSCLNEARQRLVSSAAHPASAPTQVCPVAQAKGSQTWGRLFFAYFLLAKQKKVSAPPGAYPGQPHQKEELPTPYQQAQEPEINWTLTPFKRVVN